VNNPTDLNAVRARWNRLTASLPEDISVFTSWEYVYANVTHFKPEGWFVVLLFDGDENGVPIAIFPLIYRKVNVDGSQVNICEPLGMMHCPFTEFHIQALYRRPALDALTMVLRKHYLCDVLLFGQMHEDSKTYQHLLETIPAAQIKIIRKPAYPYIDSRHGSLKAYVAQKKESVLEEVFRRERRLSEVGKVDFRIITERSEIEAQVRELCRLSIDRFGPEHLYAWNSEWTEFVVELTLRLADIGITELSALYVDDRIVASHIGYVSKGRRYCYLIAYQPEFKRFSPSKTLLYKLIEKTFSEGGIFCFGPGLYPYKVEMSQLTAEVKVPWLFLNDTARPLLDGHINFEKFAKFFF
jgi:CelD/BcsL family acetyltransferase involved in cellulose biosynthesis